MAFNSAAALQRDRWVDGMRPSGTKVCGRCGQALPRRSDPLGEAEAAPPQLPDIIFKVAEKMALEEADKRTPRRRGPAGHV